MKVKATYKQYPALEILKSENKFLSFIEGIDNSRQIIFNKEDREKIKGNIFSLTTSFCTAMVKSQEALEKLYYNGEELKKNYENSCGAIIFPDLSRTEQENVCIYKIENGNILVASFLLNKTKTGGKKSAYLGDIGVNSNDRRELEHTDHSLGLLDLVVNVHPNKELIKTFPLVREDIMTEDLSTSLICVLLCLAFKKYAEVETKEIIDVVDPSKAPKNVCKSLALQNTPFDFQITKLSADWYTEIIRTTGFEVRGHWRLQPYSNGKRRLIFIQPFMKHGYHRKAKIQEE